MPYDASKDTLMADFPDKDDAPRTGNHILVQVYQYGDGDLKVQLQRYLNDKPVKLGRMTLEEVERVIPNLQEAVNHFKKQDDAEG